MLRARLIARLPSSERDATEVVRLHLPNNGFFFCGPRFQVLPDALAWAIPATARSRMINAVLRHAYSPFLAAYATRWAARRAADFCVSIAAKLGHSFIASRCTVYTCRL